MNKEKLLVRLRELNRNNSKYKDLAKVLLNNLDNIKKLNINKVSELSFTSAPTVVRACQYLGLTGYKELVQILTSNEIIEKDNFQKQLDDIINDTNLLIDDELISKVSNLLHNHATEFIMIAKGESFAILQIFKYRLMRLGIKTHTYDDPENLYVDLQQNENKKTMLVLSVSGETTFVNNAVEYAIKKNIEIFSITTFSPNNLNKLCNKNLYIAHNPMMNVEISKVNIISIFLILNKIFEKIISFDINYYDQMLIKDGKKIKL